MVRYGCVLPYRSVVATSDDGATFAAKLESDMVGLARRIEDLGFDSAWLGDRVLEFWRPEPLVMLAAVATATDAIDLGTAVHITVLRHPIHVAHQTATLDAISGGRFVFGIGVGADDVDRSLEQFGLPVERRGARIDEQLDIITELWSGEPVSYDGEFYQLDEASIGFGPCRTPPIYVASGAWENVDAVPDPVLNRIVTHGDGWIPLKTSAEKYGEVWPEMEAHVEAAGRDPGALDPAVYLDVLIGDTDEVVAEAGDYLSAYYTYRFEDPTPEEVRNWGVFGSAAEVEQQLGEYVDAGVETFVLRMPTLTRYREQLPQVADLIESL